MLKAQKRQKEALLNFRNDRIKEAYGGPCPYKRPPKVTDYTTRPVLSASKSREYCAPISKSSRIHTPPQNNPYENIILGDKRPVSASRLKFNHTLEDDFTDSDWDGGKARQTRKQRPVSTGAYVYSSPPAKSKQANQHSPRRLNLTSGSATGRSKSARTASILLECSDKEAELYHLEDDSVIKEKRAVLAISAALVDTRVKDCKRDNIPKEKSDIEDYDAYSSVDNYYDETEEDFGEDAVGEVKRASPKPLEKKSLKFANTHQRRFHHYPSRPQQDEVAAMGELELRRIVPNYDKNYLRARPIPAFVKAPRTRVPKPVLPKEQLSSRGLFTYPTLASDRDDNLCPGTSNNNSDEVKLKRPEGAKSSSRSQQNRSARPHSGIATTTKPPSNSGRKMSAGYARRVTNAVSESNKHTDMRKNSKESSSSNSTRGPATGNNSPSRKNSKSVNVTQDSFEKCPNEAGEEMYEVGMMVQAQYKGRAQWWQGKIVAKNKQIPRSSVEKITKRQGRTSVREIHACNSFKYDILYGETLEKDVSPRRIRKRKLSAKTKLKGIIAKDVMTDKILHSEGFPEYTENDRNPRNEITQSTTEKDKKNSIGCSPNLKQLGEHSSPPPLHGSENLGQGDNVMSKMVLVASIKEGVELTSCTKRRRNMLNDIKNTERGEFGSFRSPLEDLKKTVTNEKNTESLSNEEKAQEELKRKEKLEREKLYEELETIASESNNIIAFTDVAFEKVIGRGKFASVHKATYCCKVHSEKHDHGDNFAETLRVLERNYSGKELEMVVAVKALEHKNAYPLYSENTPSPEDMTESPLPPAAQIQETIREIKALQALRHPNVINFYGVALRPRLCVALELLDSNLAEVLRVKADQNEHDTIQFGLHSKLQVMRDICSGLAYVHSQGFAHLDIKPHNILIRVASGSYAAKLADFGTAERLKEGEKLTKQVGTSGYSAPEISMPGRYDQRVDIFSFAVVLWELLVHNSKNKGGIINPFAGKDLDEAACDAHGGVRPSLEESCFPELNPVVMQAWATDPAERNSLQSILDALNAVVCYT